MLQLLLITTSITDILTLYKW